MSVIIPSPTRISPAQRAKGLEPRAPNRAGRKQKKGQPELGETEDQKKTRKKRGEKKKKKREKN
ncbi:hypothetical protein, partial [Escherichia coli]|uniref:hypothetical protein n=1 Tax=Escherichia coli TaxID=562 RepID=UPI002023CC16